MAKVIPENKRIMYSREEIHGKFQGKWLYLVNAEYTDSSVLLRAKVAVVANERYEDWEKGIYQKLKTESNVTMSEYGCLLSRPPGITSIRSI